MDFFVKYLQPDGTPFKTVLYEDIPSRAEMQRRADLACQTMAPHLSSAEHIHHARCTPGLHADIMEASPEDKAAFKAAQ